MRHSRAPEADGQPKRLAVGRGGHSPNDAAASPKRSTDERSGSDVKSTKLDAASKMRNAPGLPFIRTLAHYRLLEHGIERFGSHWVEPASIEVLLDMSGRTHSN